MSAPKRAARQTSLAAKPARNAKGAKKSKLATKAARLKSAERHSAHEAVQSLATEALGGAKGKLGKSTTERLESAIVGLATRVETAEHAIFAHLAELEHRLDLTTTKVRQAVNDLIGAHQVGEFLSHLADIRDRLDLAFRKFETPQVSFESMTQRISAIQHGQANATERMDTLMAVLGELTSQIERMQSAASSQPPKSRE